MNNYQLTIGHLYGDLMNTYGDDGNVIALKKRAEWRGIKVKIVNISVGNRIPTSQVGTQIDLYFFGGGQDQSQSLVASDLESSDKGKVIKQDIERGVPLLAICGGYQLLGEYYKPHDGPRLEGVGLFPIYTVAGEKRMIGNIVVQVKNSELRIQNEKNNSKLKTLNSKLTLVGFENHSGKTYLRKNGQPLGMVLKGFGNNGEDGTEGCVYKNAVGCYIHGSLLPKNPQLADWLLQKALEVKYGEQVELEPLDDEIEQKAHDFAISKFS